MYHFWYTYNSDSTYKKLPFVKVATITDVILVSDYHDCKRETIKLIP